MLNESRVWEPFSIGYTEKVFCVSMFSAKRERILAAIRPGRVLDMGCGPVTFLLRDLVNFKNMKVFATDFCLKMLKAAQQSLQSDNLLFVLADNRSLPFPDGSLDTVISVNSILPEDRSDVDLMVAEVFRVLRDTGRFVAVLPAFETSIMAWDHWGIEIQIDTVNHREYDTTGWQCFYTRDDIDELMTRHGFASYHSERLYFMSDKEIDAIRKLYGNEMPVERLLNYPLFEHFVVAEK